MIARVWYGWTTPENADAYEALLRTEVFPWIAAKKIVGFHRIELLRAHANGEVEFATLMWFESMAAIKAFAGADYEIAVVRPDAHALLKHYDARSRHYEVVEACTAA
ncbi:MAG: antibiotic biosynthesis monooxygenase [Pseudolabrys sp.]